MTRITDWNIYNTNLFPITFQHLQLTYHQLNRTFIPTTLNNPNITEATQKRPDVFPYSLAFRTLMLLRYLINKLRLQRFRCQISYFSICNYYSRNPIPYLASQNQITTIPDSEEIEQDLSDIIKTLNDEFDLSRSEVIFWLHEHDISQISCALEFRNLRWQTVFEYYFGGDCRDRVDIDSDWYAELVDSRCSDGSSTGSYSDGKVCCT